MGRKFRVLLLALVLGAVYGLPRGRARADATGGIPPGGAPPETGGGCSGDTPPEQKRSEKPPATTTSVATPTNPTDSPAPTEKKAPAKRSYPVYGDGRCGTATTPPCGNPEAPQHGVP
jgi:hypothetical protein